MCRGGGSGYVRNVTFSDFRVENVDYPILVCPFPFSLFLSFSA
jgi:hypothetical protein